MGHFDRFMSQPVDNALTELEIIANCALHPNKLSPTPAAQLPEAHQTPYFPVQQQESDPWGAATSAYDHPHERYVAGPIAGSFELHYPLPSQPSFPSTSPYDFGASVPSTMMLQFPGVGSGPAGTQHYSQPLPQGIAGDVNPEQSLQSPLQQGYRRTWEQEFPTEFAPTASQSQQGQTWARAGGGHTSPERSATRPPRGRHQKRPSRSRGPHH